MPAVGVLGLAVRLSKALPQAFFGGFQQIAGLAQQRPEEVVGGDLGWVRAGQLPPQLAAAARVMQAGQLQGPIEIPGGFSILYLINKRQVLMADPNEALLSLKQISIAFPKGTTAAAADEAGLHVPTDAVRRAADPAQVEQSLPLRPASGPPRRADSLRRLSVQGDGIPQRRFHLRSSRELPKCCLHRDTPRHQ